MKFYHYTSVSLAENILSSSISAGHLNRLNGEMIHDVVWLTTDDSHRGHGLTTGEKLTSSNVAYLERVQGAPIEQKSTLDKTQIRITVNIPESETGTLQPFVDYCKINENKLYAKIYGLSAYYDLKTLPPEKLRKLVKTRSTKESTWWLSWTPVETKHFSSIDFNINGKFLPYSFEEHGRKCLQDVGIEVVSAKSLESLARIIQPAHRLEQPKATVFCKNPHATPEVFITGGEAVCRFSIVNKDITDGVIPENISDIKEWIGDHETELLACWGSAVESFYRYYPEKRGSATVYIP